MTIRLDHDMQQSSPFLSSISPYVYSGELRNLMRISRELSLPYQTMRFKVGRLVDQGITVLPALQPQNFGLTRIRANFRLSREVKENSITAFFGGLYQVAGLHYFARSLISGLFDCEFLAPSSRKKELTRILRGLEEMKLISDITVSGLRWKEVLKMKTQLYDYEKGEWDVDYSTLKIDPALSWNSEATQGSTNQFDHSDLLVIKSLQIDPWARVAGIAQKINLSPSDASYHLKKHVFGRRQISGFRLKWIGTKNAWSKHGIIGMTLVFRNLHEEASLRNVIAVVTSSPFTWNHMGTDDDSYIAELLIPISHFSSMMRYLSENLRRLDLPTPELLFPDWSCVSSFTIPYAMHDVNKGWTMDAERSLTYVLQTIAA